MTKKELMLMGELYKLNDDKELNEDFMRARRLTRLFNSMTEEQMEERKEIIKELFKSTGENVHVEQTFHCDYGCHISVGENFYANYDCIMVDVCEIIIGDNVLLAPRVGIYTAGHPIDAAVRNEGLEFGKPVIIGDNVWIGGNAVINPGVTIGSGVVIGSGSVVTKDIPDHVVAVGNPCRVLRKINEEDKIYWEKEREKYYQRIGQP
ncbi:Maltose O-acetyltransferase [[Clostridium] scindens]|uniref:sugar O-acetyltransferase n=2 Tax=Clostridium scindens (strain JCM 10418 / VPI 12708) TaxID=29347 RepID=UPI0004192EFB|nr:sugar O-acetyltransferase [[Clostridium] scindens]MCQ4688683.1 sugar O-acetyltransferase [Clostridium sp. SL.3.18]MCB6285338.1 sugar O-acetyltransferase [[Clostridium] scindens]MCB6419843.1 sugar O-acetyltransferase [[Clostridium] scindens]MCB7191660.1 sugar O-acetyltransferase [[Clostridium] scindens]MCB7284843.1 sugar O-acetyltransferase [[Clostridium] scindens]